MKLIRHFLVCVAALATTFHTTSAVDPSSLRSRSDEAVRDPNGSEMKRELVDTPDDFLDDVLPALALEFKAVEAGLAVEVDTDQTLDNDRRLRGFTEEKAKTLPKTPKATAKPTSKPATTTKTPATPKSTKPTRTHAPSTTPTPAPTIVYPEPTNMTTLTPTM